MQRRSLSTKNAPGLLGCFGGHIEPGEGPLDAIRREISEETSLDVDKLELKLIAKEVVQNPVDAEDTLSIHLYETFIANDEFSVYEGQGSEIYDFEELLQRSDLAPTAKAILTHL